MTIELPVGFASVGIDAIFGKFGIDWHLLLIQGVNFLCVVFVLYRFAFRPVLKTMDARRAEIESGLKYASDMKLELENLNSQRQNMIDGARTEAAEIIFTAQQQAKIYGEQQKAEMAATVESMFAKAKDEISAERDTVLKNTKNELKYLVVDLAAKVLEKTLSQSDKDNFIQAASAGMRDVFYAKKNQ
ncbi:MAG: F0F1 ATP synthase subunit B [Puniceicoccales bacterium]|jgi:F-type H+-transporting ATPase subunit b|nr:F0F1 ATP synthase subunit B [Puniceicoccales bacterium]